MEKEQHFPSSSQSSNDKTLVRSMRTVKGTLSYFF